MQPRASCMQLQILKPVVAISSYLKHIKKCLPVKRFVHRHPQSNLHFAMPETPAPLVSDKIPVQYVGESKSAIEQNGGFEPALVSQSNDDRIANSNFTTVVFVEITTEQFTMNQADSLQNAEPTSIELEDAESADDGFDRVEDAVAAIKAGKPVIVVDAKDRENEGDFICAAEHITPEIINFMLRHGAGVLCVPMTAEFADRLELYPAVANVPNNTPFHTNFLVQVDHIDSGTGVSTENRARTVRELANPNSQPSDFMKPGHISPLLAKEGGVLRRAGHTEATVDLCRMAGLQPVGCLIEILSPSGSGMANGPELQEMAREFDIPIITITRLIRYRREREQLVKRVVEVPIKTADYGTPSFVAYEVQHEDQEPLAIVWGDLSSVEAPLIRMHSSCFTGDVLGSLRCDCGDQLHMAMTMISKEGAGAVVYLPQEGRGIGLVAKLKAYELQDQGFDTVEANLKLGFKSDLRDYMVGLQILKDLGLKKIRLLTNNPKKTGAFEKWVDLKVVEQIPIIAPCDTHRKKYMDTKRDKMGHSLPKE